MYFLFVHSLKKSKEKNYVRYNHLSSFLIQHIYHKEN